MRTLALRSLTLALVMVGTVSMPAGAGPLDMTGRWLVRRSPFDGGNDPRILEETFTQSAEGTLQASGLTGGVTVGSGDFRVSGDLPQCDGPSGPAMQYLVGIAKPGGNTFLGAFRSWDVATDATCVQETGFAEGVRGGGVHGSKLAIRNSPDRSKQAITITATDPNITLGGGNRSFDDPVQHGATLDVQTVSVGPAISFVNQQLDRAGWRYVGRPGTGEGYQYQLTTHGIAVSAMVRPAKGTRPGEVRLKVVGPVSSPDALMPTRPDPVYANLEIGERYLFRFCATFGGTVEFTPNESYVATDAPAVPCPFL